MDRKPTTNILVKLGATGSDDPIATVRQQLKDLEAKRVKVEQYQQTLTKHEVLKRKSERNLILMAVSFGILGAILAAGLVALAFGASVVNVVITPIALPFALSYFIAPALGMSVLIAEILGAVTLFATTIKSIVDRISLSKKISESQQALSEAGNGLNEEDKKSDALQHIEGSINELQGEIKGLKSAKLKADTDESKGIIGDGLSSINSYIISFSTRNIGELNIEVFCNELTRQLDLITLQPEKKQGIKLDLSKCNISSVDTVFKILEVLAKKGITISEINLAGNNLSKNAISGILQHTSFESMTRGAGVALDANGTKITISRSPVSDTADESIVDSTTLRL